MARCLVLLNPRAGTLKDLRRTAVGGETPAALIADAFASAGKEVDVRMAPPRDLGLVLDEIRAADSHDEIIVGGGDGSLSRSLGRLLASGKTFGVLPFGTLNLLARDLGVPQEMKEAIASLARAEPRRIDLASINGRPFHSISGLGFFAQMAQAREAVRGVRGFGRYAGFAMAAFRAFFRSGRSRYELVIDGAPRRVEATAVLVTNNAFADGAWRRPRLDEGLVEVVVAHAGTMSQRMRLAFDVVRGGWRKNPLIESFRAQSVVVDKLRRNRVWVATDGELSRERCPIRYEAMPGAAVMLTPVIPAGRAAEAPVAVTGGVATR
ncbi:diacylglycerol/lipid kinase family protein [Hansschlegelia plantiphila]|uniref:Diacylglycerol kinase n=1 Tax=Hansschlegelia plantiphila TaxID=374655 RepID=A0A9W6J2M2_9HYPH|nr:diacylglycerol kinase family protein [Hansschlegelia plantiphila]GLK68661.1 diacylglycerol kinase [Hansschlegelia plantiphila]